MHCGRRQSFSDRFEARTKLLGDKQLCGDPDRGCGDYQSYLVSDRLTYVYPLVDELFGVVVCGAPNFKLNRRLSGDYY